jgi:hypothetical protein
MEAKEIRIGNLVKARGGVEYVTYIYPEHIGTPKHLKLPLTLVKPIPLTEEWLLKFGFKKNYKLGLYYKGGHAIDIHREGNAEFYTGEYGGWFVFIEHVHQLQNLYFALTGEELVLTKWRKRDEPTTSSEEA